MRYAPNHERRIALRIAYYVPNASFLDVSIGGDPVMVRSLLNGLRGRGHDVQIVSRLDSTAAGGDAIPVRRLLREAIAVRGKVRQFAPDAWLIYSPSQGAPDLFGWWQRPKRYVLYGAHAPGAYPPLRAWRSLLLALAHRRSTARADKLIAWRPDSADSLRAYGIAEERLCLLLNAAERWEPMPSREEARRRLGLPQGAPIILCAGRFSMNKKGKEHKEPKKTEMMLDLIAAVAQLPPDVTLLLVGDNGRGRQRLEEEAAKIGPEGRVRVIVSLDHDDIKWYFAACDLYAYPHPKDTPWVSVLEAQYCGRPVVTMRTRSAELSVEEGRTGLLADDLDQFGDHLAALVGDRTRREAMGAAGREYIARHHSIEVRVGQIEDFLLGRG